MQFIFTDEQTQFRDAVQRFLRDKSPTTEVRRLMETEEGFDRQVWEQMCGDLGLAGIHIPEAYGGLGLTVSMEDGAVKVVAPQEDTPAGRAGIKSGDYITHINGKLIYGGTLDEAVDQMRGPPGTSIGLTLFRTGRDEPIEVKITRQIIELKPVDWKVRINVGRRLCRRQWIGEGDALALYATQ